MQFIEHPELTVHGVSVRTSNAAEQQPSSARIGALWAQFGQQVAPGLQGSQPTYSVYHRYAADANGAYDVLIGTPQAPNLNADWPTSSVTIAAGLYLVFAVDEGPLPQAIVAAWGRVWDCFAAAKPWQAATTHPRRYLTDFEQHSPDGKVSIWIGVQP